MWHRCDQHPQQPEGTRLGLEHAVQHATPSWRQWRAWVRREPALAELDPEALHRELATPDRDRQDVLLGTLVLLAQHGPHPDVAVLVVVRGLLAGIRHRIGRYRRRLDRAEAVSVFVAGLVENIARYDLAAQPRYVASRLLSMPTGRLRRAAESEHAWTVHRRDLADVAGIAASGGLHDNESVIVDLLELAVDAQVITEPDAWLVRATRLDGVPLRHAAQQLRVGYEAARKRRQRVEQRCAVWWSTHAETNTGEAAA